MLPATSRPLTTDQRTGSEAVLVVDVVDDVIDKLLRQSGHGDGHRSTDSAPSRLDRMEIYSKMIGPHTSVFPRPQSPSHPLTTSDMYPFDPLVRFQTHKSCGRWSSLGDLASLNPRCEIVNSPMATPERPPILVCSMFC